MPINLPLHKSDQWFAYGMGVEKEQRKGLQKN